MKAVSRKELKQETRKRLINAGINIILHDGYESFTTSAISKAAGIAQPGFYVHFKNVKELLREIIQNYKTDYSQPRVENMLQLAKNKHANIEEAIKLFISQEIDVAVKTPVIFHLASNYHRFKNSELQEVIADEYQFKIDQFCIFLKAYLKHKGVIQKQELITMTADLIISGNEAVILGLLEKRFKNKENAIDLMLHNTMQNIVFLVNFSNTE